jgi:hypothetical protein
MGFMRHAMHHRRHHHGPWGRGFPFGPFGGPPGWDEEDEPEAPPRGPSADRGPESPRV